MSFSEFVKPYADGYEDFEAGGTPVTAAILNTNYDGFLLALNDWAGDIEDDVADAKGDITSIQGTLNNKVDTSTFNSLATAVQQMGTFVNTRSKVTISNLLQSGTRIGVLSIDDTPYNLYAPSGGGGGGSSVVWNQILESGTKIAEVTIDDVKYDVYSPTPIDEIIDLTDVSVTSLQNGQILKWNSTTSKWENSNESVGTTVIANPSEEATDVLETIQIGDTVYESGGGTTVVANPTEEATDVLETIQIGDTVYEAGGGGGTTVIANPEEEATDVLETIQIGDTVYEAGGGGGSDTVELTLAQYNALTPEQKMLDIHYVITDVNGNADDYSSIQPIISDAYSSESTYEVGDYVIRSNRLYKCNTAITEPENWDATKWTETQVVDELGSGGSGGHTIIDESGTSMTERSGLQFVGGANISDDSVNNKTIVDIASAGGIDGVFIDTENVVQAAVNIPANSTESYTATEDCCVRTKLWCNGNNNASEISIDNIVVGTVYNIDGAVYYVHYLKKGQTISFSVSAESEYTVYGVQTGTTHSKFQPVIYSEEEKQIGVWEDGKPLYQKTFVIDTITSGVSYVDSVITSDMEIKHTKGFYIFKSDGTVSPDPHRSGDNTYQCALTNLGYYNGHGVIEIALGSGRSNTFSGTFTIQYTKTTDTPGSGIWTPQGVPAVHYSTDEQIIGTWIDGKTLYQKTVVSQINNTGEFSITHNSSVEFGLVSDYVFKVKNIENEHIDYISGRNSFDDGYDLSVSSVNDTLIYGLIGNSLSFSVYEITAYVTIQYTKPTD